MASHTTPTRSSRADSGLLVEEADDGVAVDTPGGADSSGLHADRASPCTGTSPHSACEHAPLSASTLQMLEEQEEARSRLLDPTPQEQPGLHSAGGKAHLAAALQSQWTALSCTMRGERSCGASARASLTHRVPWHANEPGRRGRRCPTCGRRASAPGSGAAGTAGDQQRTAGGTGQAPLQVRLPAQSRTHLPSRPGARWRGAAPQPRRQESQQPGGEKRSPRRLRACLASPASCRRARRRGGAWRLSCAATARSLPGRLGGSRSTSRRRSTRARRCRCCTSRCRCVEMMVGGWVGGPVGAGGGAGPSPQVGGAQGGRGARSRWVGATGLAVGSARSEPAQGRWLAAAWSDGLHGGGDAAWRGGAQAASLAGGESWWHARWALVVGGARARAAQGELRGANEALGAAAQRVEALERELGQAREQVCEGAARVCAARRRGPGATASLCDALRRRGTAQVEVERAASAALQAELSSGQAQAAELQQQCEEQRCARLG